MGKFILMFTAALILSGCDYDGKEIEAKQAIEAYGFTDVNVKWEDFAWLQCASEDFYRFKFTAKRDGKIVKGAACGGLLFKSWTVRINP